MAEDNPPRTTITMSGTVVVRQLPSLLLMIVRLRAAEVTLELRLAKLRKQCEQTSQWLKRLGAVSVEFGEPHFAAQADMGPQRAIRAAARTLGKGSAESADQRWRNVNVVVTARWHIASMSAEEILLLVDRLRFEAAEDAGAAETTEEIPSWASPVEQMREVMARIQESSQDDPLPQILFIARLAEEQLDTAWAEAFSRARRSAERLARAAEMRLGRLWMLHTGSGGLGSLRPDKMMERQRCAAILAGATYDLDDDEIVSDGPQPAEFTISVNVSYLLERRDIVDIRAEESADSESRRRP